MKIFSFPRCCSAILLREYAHVHAAALPYQPIKRAASKARQSGALAMSDEELRDPSGSGEFEKSLCWIVTFKNLDVRTGSVCDRQPRVQCGLIRRGDTQLIYVRHNKFSMEPLGYDLSGFHHCQHVRARSDAYENPFLRTELLFDPMAFQVFVELTLDYVRGYQQRHFTQLRQPLLIFPRLELLIRRMLHRYHRRRIYDFDLIGVLDERKWDGLINTFAGNSLHLFAQFGDVLDVDGSDHVNPGIHQFLHILPARRIPQSWWIVISQPVDNADCRTPCDERIHIDGRAIADFFKRYHFQFA